MKRPTSDERPQILALPLERVESMILLVREQKVMLDHHLAQLYDVETRVLTQAELEALSARLYVPTHA